MTDLLHAASYPTCTEAVTRHRGTTGVAYAELQPCGKTTVAVRYDDQTGEPYPVCAHHARADMVPLAKILEAMR